MTTIRFTADSTAVHVVLNHLAEVITPVIREEVVLGMRRAGAKTAKYPPERPGQTYQRTGIYGAGITVTPLGANIAGAALTLTARHKGKAMSSFVAGDKLGRGQARVHIGRWTVARIAVDEEMYIKVPQEIDKRLQQEIKKADPDL